MPETIAALFFAHVLADYVFQTKTMVARKHEPAFLAYHGLIVLVTAILATGSIAWPIFALSLSHMFIDWLKTRAKDDARAHLADQLAHLIVLTAVGYWQSDIWQAGIWAGAPLWVPHMLLLSAGAIYATRAGGFAVGLLMKPFGNPFVGVSLHGGGALIGQLERGLIYILMIAGQPIGIGFLVASKSILRFESAKKGPAAKNTQRSEYVIIGTLASFGWAIVTSLFVLLVLNALPALDWLQLSFE